MHKAPISIDAGAWVTIKGIDISPIAGRPERADEIVDGQLPATLMVLSVTIDGNPGI